MHIVDENKQKNNKRSFFGIVLIIVGLVLIARKMDILPPEVSHVIISWQMLLIGIGLLSIFTKENLRAGIILIAVGSFFMIPKFFDIPYELRNILWPSIFVIIGFLMLTVRGKGRTAIRKGDPVNMVDVFNFMSGGNRKITSENFQGGKVTSIFGGGELDLSSAKMQDNQIVIDMFTLFGGSEIIVPRGWNVQVEVTAIFGGFEDKRGPVDTSHPEYNKTLIVKGLVLFGGGEIKSY